MPPSNRLQSKLQGCGLEGSASAGFLIEDATGAGCNISRSM
jgi:hypothetical protein